MTEFKFEDLRKKTVAQLRKIAEGMEHEALQDPAKMPKEELLAALCQALGVEAGESPEQTAQDKEPAAQEDTASESAPDSSTDEEPAVQEGKAAEASEKNVEGQEPAAEESETAEPPKESAKEEPAAAQKDAASEPPKESAKKEPAAAQKDAASEPLKESAKEEPAPDGADKEEPATKKSAKKQKPPTQESTPTESPVVVNKEKTKLKVQIRELKSQRDAALEAHDHVQLKAIRGRIRTLKRKVRRIAV